MSTQSSHETVPQTLNWAIPELSTQHLVRKHKRENAKAQPPVTYPNALVQLLVAVSSFCDECKRIGINAQSTNTSELYTNDRLVVPLAIVSGLVSLHKASCRGIIGDTGLSGKDVDRLHRFFPQERWSSSIPFFVDLTSSGASKSRLSSILVTRLDQDLQNEHGMNKGQLDVRNLMQDVEYSLWYAADLLRVSHTNIESVECKTLTRHPCFSISTTFIVESR